MSEFRTRFGLRADVAYVSSTFGDPAFRSDAWGAPLTEEENEELFQRVRRVHATRPALPVARGLPGYGGAYFDQRRDGMPVFLFTTGLERADERIRQALGSSTDYEIRRVERSLDDLDAIRDSIRSSRPLLADSDIDIVTITYDIRNNIIRLGVKGPVDRAIELLRPWSSAITVFEMDYPLIDVCSDENCPPAKAGLQLDGNAGFCTSGFVGMRTDGPDHQVLLTAGWASCSPRPAVTTPLSTTVLW